METLIADRWIDKVLRALSFSHSYSLARALPMTSWWEVCAHSIERATTGVAVGAHRFSGSERGREAHFHGALHAPL